MPSGRDRFGRRGLGALLALSAYLLFLSGLLIGPALPVLVLLAAAAGFLVVAYLRNPGAVRRWNPRRGRRIESREGEFPSRAVRRGGHTEPRPVRRRQLPVRDPSATVRRGLAAGSPMLRMVLGRNWRSPTAMARDFALLAAGGVALLLTGLVLPNWPLMSWVGEVLSMLGTLVILISSGVLYSYWRDRM